MSSLRFRLIVGFALVAVIPLAVTTALLSRRIGDAVRGEAADRLAATLQVVEGRLRADASRIEEQVGFLSRDPILKRLVLVEPGSGPDLAEYLAERRVLLGLDFLFLVDSSGAVAADAALAPLAAMSSAGEAREVVPARRLSASRHDGLSTGPLRGAPGWAIESASPLRYRDARVGTLRGGIVLDSAQFARLGRASGVELRLEAPGDHGFSHTGLARSFALALGPEPHARVLGRVSTAAADRAIADLQRAALVLALLGVAIAIVLGVVGSRQVSRPVERLARFSERIARGEWDEPLAQEGTRELATLVAALERMRSDLGAYRVRLVASERQAAWSQMARHVAHEIKNPLTPIAVSVAGLKRSYAQGRSDFPAILDEAARIVGEEVDALKRLLRDFTELGRFPEPRRATCPMAELFADLGALYASEVAGGRLVLDRPDAGLVGHVDREQIRRALINLIQNGLEVVEAKGRVRVAARAAGEAIALEVEDDGPGLDAARRALLFTPDFTTKPQGSGLGLVIVERIVLDHGGTIAVESEPGRGTRFRILIPQS